MNPASRLHTLLHEFNSIPKNLPLRAAIAQVFSIGDTKSPDVFRAYVSVINLALEVEERLTAMPNVNVDL